MGYLDLQFELNFINFDSETFSKEIHQQGAAMVMVRVLPDRLTDLGTVRAENGWERRRQSREVSIHLLSK